MSYQSTVPDRPYWINATVSNPAGEPQHSETATAKLELKDSGSRQEFASGAVRDKQAGKGRFDLVPSFATFAYSVIMELGAKKYADRNWEKGMPIGKYVECAQRHLAKYMLGMRDEPHLWQAFWNIGGAIHTAVRIHFGWYPKDLNNLPNHVGGESPAQPLSLVEIEALKVFLGEYANAKD